VCLTLGASAAYAAAEPASMMLRVLAAPLADAALVHARPAKAAPSAAAL
jgi:hypothetical protein